MNIVFATASQLAQMIRDKEVSVVEVLNAYLNQIEKHNDRINAIATLDTERAKQRAVEADEALAKGENWGALHGVPVTIKDTIETAGLLTTAGYRELKNYIPQQDAIASSLRWIVFWLTGMLIFVPYQVSQHFPINLKENQ